MSRIPESVVDALLGRAYGLCECCDAPEAGKMDIHHRQARGMGGSKGRDLDVLPNLLWVHDRCHADIHANPRRSRLLGHIVPSWDDFEQIPVWLLGEEPVDEFDVEGDKGDQLWDIAKEDVS